MTLTEDWLLTLPPEKRPRAVWLLSQFERLGADDPLGWTRSEIEHGIPQLSRFLILHRLWKTSIDPYRANSSGWINLAEKDGREYPLGYFGDAGQALSRMEALGVPREDIGAVARMVAYQVAFDVVNVIDQGYDAEMPDDYPGWELREVDPITEKLRGHVGGLHEELLTMDPSGREGRPPGGLPEDDRSFRMVQKERPDRLRPEDS